MLQATRIIQGRHRLDTLLDILSTDRYINTVEFKDVLEILKTTVSLTTINLYLKKTTKVRKEIFVMLQLKNIVKTYVTGDLEQKALKGVSISFRENEFVSILGQSGSGKNYYAEYHRWS